MYLCYTEKFSLHSLAVVVLEKNYSNGGPGLTAISYAAMDIFISTIFVVIVLMLYFSRTKY